MKSMISNHSVSFNGISIAMKISGEGNDAIIFAHSGCMSSATLLPQLENGELSQAYKLIAFDLPGHGDSGQYGLDTSQYRPKNISPLLKVIAKEQNVKRCLLVGISYGTLVIGELKDGFDACAGVMLVSPFILNEQHLPEQIFKPVPLGHIMMSENPPDHELEQFAHDNTKNNETACSYISSYKKTAPAFRSEFGKFIMERDWSDQLKNISDLNVPVCVVFGEDETLIDTNYLDDFTALSKQRVKFIKDAGHLPNQEQPQAFNSVLQEFAREMFR